MTTARTSSRTQVAGMDARKQPRLLVIWANMTSPFELVGTEALSRDVIRTLKFTFSMQDTLLLIPADELQRCRSVMKVQK